MAEEIIREIIGPSGNMRVIITRREDDRYSYRCQQSDAAGWSSPTIDAGIYDSADTAEMEARQRVPWLRALFH